ncbi:hypothetical protein VNO77_33031 [Canavalia gladiata]|uniref:Uncharacterized protein n=1 Tax=Canavalia gladiata TaxID=3824 RepID=A0AAN9KD19_CANGL
MGTLLAELVNKATLDLFLFNILCLQSIAVYIVWIAFPKKIKKRRAKREELDWDTIHQKEIVNTQRSSISDAHSNIR